MRTAVVFLLLFTCGVASSQGKRADTTRFRLNLPSYWSYGDKVWQILNDALPQICPELEGKELCVEPCPAAYTIDLHISEPKFSYQNYSRRPSSNQLEEYDLRTYYTFKAALYLRNPAGTVIVDMTLVDTNEAYFVTDKISIPAPGHYQPPKFYPPSGPNRGGGDEVANTQGWLNALQNASNKKIGDYLKKPGDKLVINPYELYKIINTKFYSLKD